MSRCFRSATASGEDHVRAKGQRPRPARCVAVPPGAAWAANAVAWLFVNDPRHPAAWRRGSPQPASAAAPPAPSAAMLEERMALLALARRYEQSQPEFAKDLAGRRPGRPGGLTGRGRPSPALGRPRGARAGAPRYTRSRSADLFRLAGALQIPLKMGIRNPDSALAAPGFFTSSRPLRMPSLGDVQPQSMHFAEPLGLASGAVLRDYTPRLRDLRHPERGAQQRGARLPCAQRLAPRRRHLRRQGEERRLVGQPGRSRQAARHRSLLRHRRQQPGLVLRLDRADPSAIPTRPRTAAPTAATSRS